MNDDHKIQYLDSLTEGFMIEYDNYVKDKSGAYVRAMDNIMDLVEAVDGWGEFYHMLLAKDFDLFQKLTDVGLWKGNK
jgi:hypothetical protein